MFFELGNLATEPVMMSLGPLLGAILPGLIPVAADLLFGGGSGGGSSGANNPQLNAQSAVETDLLKRQREVVDQLLAMVGDFDPTPMGRLEGVPDSPFLDEDFLGGLRPQGDIELLKSLLGASAGTGATQSISALQGRQQEISDNRREDTASQLSQLIAGLLKQKADRDASVAESPTTTNEQQQLTDPFNTSSTLLPSSFR